jgi:S1-C subfamily serine protease
MSNRRRRAVVRAALALVAVSAVLAAAAPGRAAEKRKQPLLRVNGELNEAKGGFVVESVVPGGPSEKLTPADGGADPVKLRPGDVITEVEGVTPADFRDFQDLVHFGFQQNKGKVTLTVRAGGTGEAKRYTVVPEEAEVELAAREKKVGLPAGLDKPLPVAPPPPVVPPHVRP